jgi:glycine cleavage system H protein
MTCAVLACNGVDKTEGALAREVGLQVAEATGGDVICPVLLNRAPTRYEKALTENALIVVDGCGTRCASKLATGMGAKPKQKVLVSTLVKASGEHLEASLRLGPGEMALAKSIVADIVAALSASETQAAPAVAWDAQADFLVVVFEKFEFRIPKQGYWFSENDTWARVMGNRARVGISDYLQQQLTDIVYFDPPKVGTLVGQFGELGAVESSKAVFELIAPVSGTVVAVNEVVVQESPGLINEDPYGAGWLVEVELSAWAEDGELLLNGPTYADTVGPKAAEY